jgi:hypothetical protein
MPIVQEGVYRLSRRFPKRHASCENRPLFAQGAFTHPIKGIVVLPKNASAVQLTMQHGFDTVLWERNGRDTQEPNDDNSKHHAPDCAVGPATKFHLAQKSETHFEEAGKC